ncbi:MAG: SRPBCC domain-containing protein [Candidatus Acidiferrales bacterium]
MTERNDSPIPANTPTRRQMIFGAALAFGGLALGSANAWADSADEISHTAEFIHMEPVFKASPSRVYEALTNTKQFDQVVKLSAAMQSGMVSGNKPTVLSPEAGGAFSLFGGYVTGRNIELVPNRRLVQAWRPGGWAPGIYSIAKFELTEQDSGTIIIFDHTGFPRGTAPHLAEGWHENYWNPLTRVLAMNP